MDPPDNFQDFLEQQWSQSAQFVLSKAEHFDGKFCARVCECFSDNALFILYIYIIYIILYLSLLFLIFFHN